MLLVPIVVDQLAEVGPELELGHITLNGLPAVICVYQVGPTLENLKTAMLPARDHEFRQVRGGSRPSTF